MEAEIAVAPVHGPRPVRDRVAQAGDREARPFRSEVLALGAPPLDNGDVSWGHFARDPDLVSGVLGDPRGAPPLHSRDV